MTLAKGAMLSGGQKARIALARAVYQDKELYLIDDIFAALDARVGHHIFRRCVQGLLKAKTKILVSHHARFLVPANSIVRLESGRIADMGSPAQVRWLEAKINKSPSCLASFDPNGKKDAIYLLC